MKPHVVASDRLELAGLLALAGNHARALKQIEMAARDTLGIGPDDAVAGGTASVHVREAIWEDGHRNVDELLERLGLKVEADATNNGGGSLGATFADRR